MTETKVLVQSDHPVILIGPADAGPTEFKAVFSPEMTVVAADGGARKALEFGAVPKAVIGDMDSFQASDQIEPETVFEIAEQDSTDFEKCLGRISAPRILAIGFLGRRIDHELAVLSALAHSTPGWCVLVGQHDVIVHCPRSLELDVEQGTRVSLFPFSRVTGTSSGLVWPIDGLVFEPAGQIGTSNRADGRVSLRFDTDGMLLSLPPSQLPQLLRALPVLQQPARAEGCTGPHTG